MKLSDWIPGEVLSHPVSVIGDDTADVEALEEIKRLRGDRL